MPRPDLSDMERELLACGISPKYVQRAITELDEHFDDLVEERVATGQDRGTAELDACAALGNSRDIANAMKQQDELRGWAWRWPRVARVVYPVACLAALPAVPLIAGIQHAQLLARWAACLMLGALVTATMFLVLQLTITLS